MTASYVIKTSHNWLYWLLVDSVLYWRLYMAVEEFFQKGEGYVQCVGGCK